MAVLSAIDSSYAPVLGPPLDVCEDGSVAGRQRLFIWRFARSMKAVTPSFAGISKAITESGAAWWQAQPPRVVRPLTPPNAPATPRAEAHLSVPTTPKEQ